MERLEKIKSLRDGILPDIVLTNRPKEATLILWMTAPCPDHRPTAAELLDLEMFKPDIEAHPQSEISAGNLYTQSVERKLELAMAELETSKCHIALLNKRVAELELELTNFISKSD